MKNCIFISCDKNFLNILTLCLQSIDDNYPNHGDIIICYTDLSSKDKNKLSKFKNILFLKNNIRGNEIGPIMSHLSKDIDSKIFYARFNIWTNSLFNDYDNVLHLDADTIILKDLNYLFRQNNFLIIKEAYKGDDQIFINFDNKDLQDKLKKDKIKIKNVAANAGVFLIPKKYRTKIYYKQIINILSNYEKEIKRADQSIINIWLYLNHIKISKKYIYNMQHRLLLNNKKENKKVKIIHFNGIDEKYRYKFMKYFYLQYQKDPDNSIRNYISFVSQFN